MCVRANFAIPYMVNECTINYHTNEGVFTGWGDSLSSSIWQSPTLLATAKESVMAKSY